MEYNNDDSELYQIAKQELDNKTYDEVLWRKAMALMGGNEEKARKKYIKLRILDLKRNGNASTSQNEYKEKDSKSDTAPHRRTTKKPKQKVEPKSKSPKNNNLKDKTKDNNSWIWWVLIAGVVIWLIVQSNSDSKSSKSSDYSSNYASTKKDNYYEKKPSSSTYTLDKNEVLYCEAEMIRLDIVKDKIDKYSQYEINKYNNLSGDYNSRCANKQYYEKDMYVVNKLIKDRRSKIEQEGLARFQKPKKKSKSKTTIHTEKKGIQKYSLTINTTPSDARVQIMNIKPKYYDGIRLVKGKYRIRVSKKGYKRQEDIVDLSGSAIYDLTLKKK